VASSYINGRNVQNAPPFSIRMKVKQGSVDLIGYQ